jgi:hypothetical protein
MFWILFFRNFLNTKTLVRFSTSDWFKRWF